MAHDATLTCLEFRDLAAVVALDAGEPEAERLVEEHARMCPACRPWLEQFRETAGVLGSLVPQLEPPQHVRQELFEAVAREPRPFALLRRLLPRRAAGRRLSPAWLVAAASLAVAVAALGWVAMLQAQISQLQSSALLVSERAARFDRVVTVLASDKLSVKPLQPAAASVNSNGYVFLDPASGTGMLMCHDLPPLGQGQAYQIWFVRGNDRVSAGMLWPNRSGDGYTMIQIPPDLQSFDSIGLTVEPGTGSKWPTTPRVLGTPLNQSDQ